MLKHKVIVTSIFLIVLTLIAYPDIDPSYQYKVPQYMKAISTAEGLRDYIYSKDFSEKITATMRLGEIKSYKSMELLKEAFNKEAYRPGNEVGKGVKFYSLISIGKIDMPESEIFLKNVAKSYSKSNYDFWGSSDSIMTVQGAVEGLYVLGSSSAIAFLDSLFNDENYDRTIRLMAHIYCTKSYLRSGAFRTVSDSASYLINELYKVIGNDKMWTEDGKINVNYITSGSYSSIIYRNGAMVLPYLSKFISELNLDDPKRPRLEKLKENIENNLPR